MNAAEKTQVGLNRATQHAAQVGINQATQQAVQYKSVDQMYVLDTTARPGVNRTHELVVRGIERPYTFEYGKPLLLSRTEAVRFLEHDAFKYTDADGNVLNDYQPTPKQPENVQAGEIFALKENETIARFDELSTAAMQHRCLTKHGGDRFESSNDRSAMISFLMAAKPKMSKPVSAKPRADDDLVEIDEEAA